MNQIQEKHYTVLTHSHFVELVFLCASLASLQAADHVFTHANASFLANRNFGVWVGGRHASYGWQVIPLLADVARGEWPAQITLVRSPGCLHKNDRTEYHADLNKVDLVGQLVGASFLKYYENQVGEWKRVLGNQPKQWPDLWRFAWIIRNAIGHGDRFSISDSSLQPCSWQCFTVSPSDNDKPWFDMDSGYLGAGDVIELMNELDCTKPPAPQDLK